MTQIDGSIRANDVSLVGGPGFYPGAVTPESLYVYLSSRLQGLDDQINVVFRKQEVSTEVRGSLNRIQSKLSELEQFADTQTDAQKKDGMVSGATDPNGQTFNEAIDGELKKIEVLDPKLGAELRQQFTGQSGILNAPSSQPQQSTPEGGESRGGAPITGSENNPPEEQPPGESSPQFDTTFTASELKATQEAVKNTLSDLEASAALDMIRLQSTMSTRQTAIQLSTNVAASLSESAKAIVGNIGR